MQRFWRWRHGVARPPIQKAPLTQQVCLHLLAETVLRAVVTKASLGPSNLFRAVLRQLNTAPFLQEVRKARQQAWPVGAGDFLTYVTGLHGELRRSRCLHWSVGTSCARGAAGRRRHARI